MKLCKKCNQTKAVSGFEKNKGKKDGLNWWCKACMADYHRSRHGDKRVIKLLNAGRKRWQLSQPEAYKAYLDRYKSKHPDRVRAGNAVRGAVFRGTLDKPESCLRCGASGVRIEGHHHDYSKPLDVEWLCRPCHAAEHIHDR